MTAEGYSPVGKVDIAMAETVEDAYFERRKAEADSTYQNIRVVEVVTLHVFDHNVLAK